MAARKGYVYLRSPGGDLVAVAPGEDFPSWAKARQEPVRDEGETKPKTTTRGRPKRTPSTEE